MASQCLWQAFLGWGVWPGHAPTALTPLDVMEFEEYMRSLPRDAFPVPLNKPAPIFSEAVSSVLHTRLAGTDRHVDKSIVDR